MIELLDPGRRKTPAAASLEAFGAELPVAGGSAGYQGPPVAVGGTDDGAAYDGPNPDGGAGGRSAGGIS